MLRLKLQETERVDKLQPQETTGVSASKELGDATLKLDAARKDEEAKTKNLDQAKKQYDRAKTSVDNKRVDFRNAEHRYSQAVVANSTISETERAHLKADLDSKKFDLTRLENELAVEEPQVRTKEALLAESRRVRESFETLLDSATTRANAFQKR